MSEVLSDGEIADRCYAVLGDIGHAKASYLERYKFDGERAHSRTARGDEVKPLSPQKISRVLGNSDRFEPAFGSGESVTIAWERVE